MKFYVDEMPKCCGDFAFCHYDDWAIGTPYSCNLIHEPVDDEDGYYSERLKDCPLQEIVRCKDCFYWSLGRCHKFPYIDVQGRAVNMWIDKEGFCSMAKRKSADVVEDKTGIERREVR